MAVYKRSIFVINPGFQYKFSFIICSIVFISSLVYPWTIYDLFEKIIALQPNNKDSVEQGRTFLLTILMLAQLAFLGVIFVVSIFISHKIAGPMFKLKNYLTNIRDGAPITKIYFRDGDSFQDIAEEVSLTMEYLQEKRKEDFEYISEVASYINNLALVVPEDKKPVLQEILSNLSKIQSRHQ